MLFSASFANAKSQTFVDSLATKEDVRSVQSTPVVIDIAMINSLIRLQLDSFKLKMDSVIRKVKSTANATVTSIDTLPVISGGYSVYYLDLSCKNSGNADVGSGYKYVMVKNVSGTVSIVRQTDILPFKGQATLANCKWNVTIVNNQPVVQVTGLTGITVNWNLSRYKSL